MEKQFNKNLIAVSYVYDYFHFSVKGDMLTNRLNQCARRREAARGDSARGDSARLRSVRMPAHDINEPTQRAERR